MRELIFRGKRIDKDEWVCGSVVFANDKINNGKTYILPGISDFSYGDNGNRIRIGCFVEVDVSTIGQFTGLHDNKGRMIFEGDTIIWEDWHEKKIQSKVVYDPEWNRFCVWANGAESLGVNEHLSKSIEIV